MEINNVILTGVVAYESKSGQSQTGTKWANFTLGHVKPMGKEGKLVTHYFRVSGFSVVGTRYPVADIIAGLQKGDRVLVEGSLQTSQYEDKDGKTQRSTEITARTVIVLPHEAKTEQPQENFGGPGF